MQSNATTQRASSATTVAAAQGGNTRSAEKVLGMSAPSQPDAADDDDAMLAWTIKHGSASERRQIAADLGVSYPSAVSILGTTCDKGEGYIGVWAVNFAATDARWNVTLDGKGYAGARVLPLSHDYGAIGVPNGRHVVAFVNPTTGAVGDRTVTALQCGAAKAPVVAPGHGAAPAKALVVAAKPAMGPLVQTDRVTSNTGNLLAMLTVAGAAVVSGGVLVGRRRF